MRNRVLALGLVCLLLSIIVFGSSIAPAQAQSSSLTCDSTVVTLLYVAEHDYGFHSAMDVSSIEKGQYKPLFDSMMAMGGNMMATQDTMMGTPGATGGNMMATQDAMMGTPDAMGSMMTSLKPGAVQGENEVCGKLRTEIEGYLYAKFSAGMKK